MTRAKTPDEIEAEIARTRSDLSRTLEAIEGRLAPRQLLEKGFDMMRDGMSGDMGKIGRVLRENPLPLALIGAGIGWLMLAQTGAGRQLGDRAADAAGSVGERVRGLIGRGGERSYAHAWTKREEAARHGGAEMPVPGYGAEHAERVATGAGYGGASSGMAERASSAARETAHSAYGTAAEAAERARDSASGAVGKVGEYGRQAADAAGEYADLAGRRLGDARDRFTRLMEDHPLAVGALGFLAGAIIGAALPSTRVEEEYLGDTREELRRGAQRAGEEMLDKARDVASTAAAAATDAAREAIGETAEAVKEETGNSGMEGEKRTEPGAGS